MARRDWWLSLALLGALLLVYYPALSGGFIWDDDAHLTANPCIVGPLGLSDVWTSAHARICPLVQTTFWLEYQLWGLNPLPYHLVNVLMHAAAAMVLWRVLVRLRVPGAWLGTMLWALHPVQVESVAWITEMKNTQSGLFFLLSVLFFCKSRLTENAAEPKSRAGLDYGLTLIFGTLALASKSSTVVLPLVLGLCAWWIDRGWRWRRNLLQLVPLLLLSVATGVVSVWTQNVEGAFDPEYARNGAERIAVAGKVVWFYAGKLLWPHPLIFMYPRWQIDTAGFAAYLPTLAAVGAIGVLWWKRDQWARAAFFAAAGFVTALLPVLGVVDHYFLRFSFVGDHFQYLASMAPLALAGAGIGLGLGAIRNQPRWLRPGLGALLLSGLGALTWRQCAMYQNDEILWTTTLQRNPSSWMAHNNLGTELAKQSGRSAEAIAHYEAVLRLRPEHAKAHYNLANEFAKHPDRRAKALAHYREAVRLRPDYADAINNLAAELAKQPGHQAESLALYEQALRLRPLDAGAHYNLAVELARQPARLAEALAHYRTALQLRPDYPEAHYNLGVELAKQPGRAAEAVAHYAQALRGKPDYAEAHYNLAHELEKLPGRQTEAIAHYEAALQSRPGLSQAHNNLAVLLAGLPGRQAQAITHYETALRLDPTNAETHYNLARALAPQPGRQMEAIAHYAEALRLRPSFAEAHNNLAAMLVQLPGRETVAMAHYEEALRLQPESAEAHSNYAVLLSGLPGRLPEAIGHFETALRLRPDAAEVHNNLAGAYYRAGRLADAIRQLEAALQAKPDYETARRNLATLRAMQKP